MGKLEEDLKAELRKRTPDGEKIKSLISEGAKVGDYKKLLRVAVQKNLSLEIIEWILKHDKIAVCEVPSVIFGCFASPYASTWNRSSEVFALLAKQISDPELRNYYLLKYLSQAIIYKDTSKIKISIELGVDLNKERVRGPGTTYWDNPSSLLDKYLSEMNSIDETVVSALCNSFRVSGKEETDLHTVIRMFCSPQAIRKVLELRREDIVQPDYNALSPFHLYFNKQGMTDEKSRRSDHFYNLETHKILRNAFEEKNGELRAANSGKTYILSQAHLNCELARSLSEYQGDFKLTQNLIEHGAYDDGRSYKGGQLFSVRVINLFQDDQILKIFELLKKHNKPVDIASQETLRIYLERKNHLNFGVISFLIENGADKNLCFGYTGGCLHRLIQSRPTPDQILDFIKLGFDMTLKNSQGLTAFALYLSQTPIDTEVVKAFIQAGADPNTKNRDGYNFLHLAISNGNNQHIREAITDMGIDVMAKTGTNATALQFYKEKISKQKQDATILDLLEEAQTRANRNALPSEEPSFGIDWILEDNNTGQIIVELLYSNQSFDRGRIPDLATFDHKKAAFEYIKSMVNEEKPKILEAALDPNTHLGQFFSFQGNGTGFFRKKSDFRDKLMELQAILDSVKPKT